MLVGADGQTPTQAARVLGISAPNFRMRLTAARRALERSLQSVEPSSISVPAHPNQLPN